MTEEGQQYLKHVRSGLHTLSDATQRFTLHSQQQETINISVPPTLASHFLLSRLKDFYRQHPSTVVNFVPYEHSHNFMENDELDMAIQFGEGEWPGTLSVYLTGKETCLPCTPTYAKEHSLSDINRYTEATLLQHAKVPLAWVHWFQDQKPPFATAHLGPRFDQYSLIIEAARLGYGIGLVPKCLATAVRASDELMSPLPSNLLAKQGYFLCIKRDKADTHTVRMFTAWLTGLKPG